MNRTRWIILFSAILIVSAGLIYWVTRDTRPPVYVVEIVATHPHDPQAFTEGLFHQDGVFYESTGEEGASSIRKVDPATGEVLQSESLPPPYFGEGIIAWKDRLYQLTWKDQKGFIYDLKDFALRDSFDYKGEGWGMTHNGKHIIMSDGTATLRFLDPETLKQVSTLAVTANGCPVAKLNELEWIDGQIYANVWQSQLIARIDPTTGVVSSFLDVSALGPKSGDIEAVPNGIAYDAKARKLFVTGKRWPQLYEVRVTDKVSPPELVAEVAQCVPK